VAAEKIIINWYPSAFPSCSDGAQARSPFCLLTILSKGISVLTPSLQITISTLAWLTRGFGRNNVRFLFSSNQRVGILDNRSHHRWNVSPWPQHSYTGGGNKSSYWDARDPSANQKHFSPFRDSEGPLPCIEKPTSGHRSSPDNFKPHPLNQGHKSDTTLGSTFCGPVEFIRKASSVPG
jgi:hypothetical protein